MQKLGRTICGALLALCLSAQAADPDAAESPTAVPGPLAAANEVPAPASSPASATPGKAQLQTTAGVDLSLAGLCPVISALVQQACSQYPDDPSCATL